MKKYFVVLFTIALLFTFSCCSAPSAPAQTSAAPELSATASAGGQTEAAASPSPSMPYVPPINILLMGSADKDFTEEGSPAYALTHILITLDQNNHVLKFTTFPYNLAVEVDDGDNTETMQLQFVCSSFGEDTAVKTLEDNFGIAIDYWVLMNMDGMTGTIDALTGIDIDETGEGAKNYSGDETASYFHDTEPEDKSRYIEEEEVLFRDHHEKIICGIVEAVKLAGLDADALVAIADSVQLSFSTDIDHDDWQALAQAALNCTKNAPQFLHIPQIIETVDINGWESLGFDKDSDVSAAKQFVGD